MRRRIATARLLKRAMVYEQIVANDMLSQHLNGVSLDRLAPQAGTNATTLLHYLRDIEQQTRKNQS